MKNNSEKNFKEAFRTEYFIFCSWKKNEARVLIDLFWIWI